MSCTCVQTFIEKKEEKTKKTPISGTPLSMLLVLSMLYTPISLSMLLVEFKAEFYSQ